MVVLARHEGVAADRPARHGPGTARRVPAVPRPAPRRVAAAPPPSEVETGALHTRDLQQGGQLASVSIRFKTATMVGDVVVNNTPDKR